MTDKEIAKLCKDVAQLQNNWNMIAPLFTKRSDGQISLNIANGLKLSNGEKLTVLFSDVEEGQTLTFPNQSGRLVTYLVIESEVDPTEDEIPQGTFSIYRNTVNDETKIWVNVNGVLKSVLFQ